MKSFLTYSLLIIIASIGFIGCGGGDYRPRAKGDTRGFVVMMDSSQWDSKTADAIRNTFGKYIYTLPNPEENYDLTFMPIRSRSQLERIRKQKNIYYFYLV